MKTKAPLVATGWIVFFLLIQLFAVLIVDDEFLFPAPTKSIPRALAFMVDGEFLGHAGSTMKETFAATLIALAFGVPCGLLIGSSVRLIYVVNLTLLFRHTSFELSNPTVGLEVSHQLHAKLSLPISKQVVAS